MAETEQFSPEVVEHLNHYVYRLVDPRNGETFYVGKGSGNRVFAHAKKELSALQDHEDQQSAKFERIGDIKKAGLAVIHLIHRHGMEEKTAFEVEAALIDAYAGLSNVVGGHKSNDTGLMHTAEVIAKYAAEEARIQHKALLINVNRTAGGNVYHAVQYAWRLSMDKAQQAELVLAVEKGRILEVFVPDGWFEATTANFPGRTSVPERVGFKGRLADEPVRRTYVGKRVPDRFKHYQNPVRYTW